VASTGCKPLASWMGPAPTWMIWWCQCDNATATVSWAGVVFNVFLGRMKGNRQQTQELPSCVFSVVHPTRTGPLVALPQPHCWVLCDKKNVSRKMLDIRAAWCTTMYFQYGTPNTQLLQKNTDWGVSRPCSGLAATTLSSALWLWSLTRVCNEFV